MKLESSTFCFSKQFLCWCSFSVRKTRKTRDAWSKMSPKSQSDPPRIYWKCWITFSKFKISPSASFHLRTTRSRRTVQIWTNSEPFGVCTSHTRRQTRYWNSYFGYSLRGATTILVLVRRGVVSWSFQKPPSRQPPLLVAAKKWISSFREFPPYVNLEIYFSKNISLGFFYISECRKGTKRCRPSYLVPPACGKL